MIGFRDKVKFPKLSYWLNRKFMGFERCLVNTMSVVNWVLKRPKKTRNFGVTIPVLDTLVWELNPPSILISLNVQIRIFMTSALRVSKFIFVFRRRIFHENSSFTRFPPRLNCVSEWSRAWLIDEKCGYFPQSCSPQFRKASAENYADFVMIPSWRCCVFFYFSPLNKLFFTSPPGTMVLDGVMCDNNKSGKNRIKKWKYFLLNGD